jgi:hypothetical protein
MSGTGGPVSSAFDASAFSDGTRPVRGRLVVAEGIARIGRFICAEHAIRIKHPALIEHVSQHGQGSVYHLVQPVRPGAVIRGQRL